MIRTRTRPMTAEERKSLIKACKSIGGLENDFHAAGCVMGVTALVLLGVLYLFGIRGAFEQEYYAAAPAVVIGVIVFIVMRRKSRKLRATDPIQKDLVDGVLIETTYTATSAIRVTETDDEGDNYLIRLEDGRVLFLSGQYLYDDVEAKRFPCTEFVITTARHSGLASKIECRGNYMSPEKTLPPFSDSDWKHGRVPEEFTIVKTSWDDLLAGKR